MKTIECKQCGGEMRKKNKAKHSQGAAILFFFGGLVLCAVFPIVGAPMLIIGLYLGCGIRKLWVCKQCEIAIERA